MTENVARTSPCAVKDGKISLKTIIAAEKIFTDFLGGAISIRHHTI